MIFRKEAIENNNKRIEGDVLLIPKISHGLISAIIVGVVCLLIFIVSTTNYPRTEKVEGWLVASNGVINVYSPLEMAIISDIFFLEGEQIKKNQIILNIEKNIKLRNGISFSNSILNELIRKKALFKEKEKLLLSNIKVKKNSLEEEKKTSQKELKAIKKHIESISLQKEILIKEHDKYVFLYKKKIISQLEKNKNKKEIFVTENEIYQLQKQKLKQQIAIQKIDEKIALIPLSYNEKLISLQEKTVDLEKEIVELKGRSTVSILSPINGIISGIQANKGEQITRKMPLFKIIPSNYKLKVNLLIPVASAGFIKEKQEIKIKYDAFPYQKFGIQNAYITKISNTILLPGEVFNSPVKVDFPVYRVEAELRPNDVFAYSEKIKLKPGMTLSGEIILEKRTILEWIIKPIFERT